MEEPALLTKQEFIQKQLREMSDPIRPFVRCGCLRKLEPKYAYRCLYCGEWYCAICAEVHFGKTRKQYREEHPVEGGEYDAG